MAKNKLVAPVVKWVGGKRQLLDEITPLLPKRITSYCEPFLGGGAVLFSIQPSKDLDRDKEAYQAMSKVERASRLIYLNKTCFNGLFRVNSSGEFNSPFGHYKNPNIVNEPVLRAVSKYFSSGNITFCNEDFAVTLSRVGKGGFVYLDPPYDPVSDTASFTGYNKGGFDRNEQIRLKQCCDELTQRGIKFMLSNSATEFIKELYKDYNISIVQAKRAINSDASKRGSVEEVLIRNYGTE